MGVRVVPACGGPGGGAESSSSASSQRALPPQGLCRVGNLIEPMRLATALRGSSSGGIGGSGGSSSIGAAVAAAAAAVSGRCVLARVPHSAARGGVALGYVLDRRRRRRSSKSSSSSARGRWRFQWRKQKSSAACLSCARGAFAATKCAWCRRDGEGGGGGDYILFLWTCFRLPG